MFFWGMSAFFNKQVVRNTAHVVKTFGLEKADAFATPGTLLDPGRVLPRSRERPDRVQRRGPAGARAGGAQRRRF